MQNDIQDNLRFLPILDLFKKRIVSKPTFYKHLREGKITMYKLGGRSYVDRLEFEGAFKKVEISN